MDCSPPGSSVHGDFPGKNTGMGCYIFFKGFFPTQASNPGLLHCRLILYHMCQLVVQWEEQETLILLLGWEDSPGIGNPKPLQCPCQESSMDRECLTGYSPWGSKESNMTKRARTHTHTHTHVSVCVHICFVLLSIEKVKKKWLKIQENLKK